MTLNAGLLCRSNFNASILALVEGEQARENFIDRNTSSDGHQFDALFLVRGETQIEADRRLIRERIAKLKGELKKRAAAINPVPLGFVAPGMVESTRGKKHG